MSATGMIIPWTRLSKLSKHLGKRRGWIQHPSGTLGQLTTPVQHHHLKCYRQRKCGRKSAQSPLNKGYKNSFLFKVKF